MKLLVFEYSTVINSSSLVSEGFNMLKSILYDLDEIKNIEIHYLLNDYFTIDGLKYAKQVPIDLDLFEWLNLNSEFYDSCFFIAPEDDLIQFKITKILEEKKVNVIGSNSYASYICSSKYRTYEIITDNILKIPTMIYDIDSVNYENINEILKENTLIIKPDDKTSSDYIYHIENIPDFKKVIKKYSENKIKKILIQKYIPGKPISVSIICKDKYIKVLSINSQEIKENKKRINYIGCKTPIQHPLKDEIIEISKEITGEIKGLEGFIGIDYIINNNKIYFVEINSRLTTPYIILHEITNKNLSKYIIDLILFNKTDEIELNNKGIFYK